MYNALRVYAALLALAAATASLAGQEINVDPAIDWAEQDDPKIVLAIPIIEWSDTLPKLWLRALQHREADVQREAADTITRAHQLGMPLSSELANELAAVLASVLDQPEQQAIARTAAARALVEIEARQSAELLAKHASQGPVQIAQVVEPALARWDYQPQRDVWLRRLAKGGRPTLLHLAAQGLAAVGENRAVTDLTRIAKNIHETPATRLAAARALSHLQRSGLEELASQLARSSTSTSRIDHLVAAQLLAQHSSDAALSLLEQLADDAEPAVAALAMRRLLESAPERLLARAEKSLAHRDGQVRHITLEALTTRPSVESIALIAPQLDDHVVENRVLARRTLLKWSADESLRGAVIEHSTAVLKQDAWRGDEQAILLLTTLDQKQVGPRLLELLDHSRWEVFVTAAWGLRTLAVPELVSQMLTAAQKISERVKDPSQPSYYHALQLAQLFEALGQMRHAPSESLLRTYIGKGPPGEPRTAAIWSLGLLLEDKPDEKLARQLEQRLADISSIPPEMASVRGMCAITLGRMNAESSLPELRKSYELETHNTYVGRCSGWAIERMTGEKLPDADVVKIQPGNWFLEPLAPR